MCAPSLESAMLRSPGIQQVPEWITVKTLGQLKILFKYYQTIVYYM